MTLILVVLEWLARIRLDMAFTTPGGGGGLDTRFMPEKTNQFKLYQKLSIYWTILLS